MKRHLTKFLVWGLKKLHPSCKVYFKKVGRPKAEIEGVAI